MGGGWLQKVRNWSISHLSGGLGSPIEGVRGPCEPAPAPVLISHLDGLRALRAAKVGRGEGLPGAPVRARVARNCLRQRPAHAMGACRRGAERHLPHTQEAYPSAREEHRHMPTEADGYTVTDAGSAIIRGTEYS